MDDGPLEGDTAFMRCHSKPVCLTLPRQCGAAAIEWLVAGTLLMLVGALSWDVVQWQTTRFFGQIALMEAARTGSVAHAHPERMESAFLLALQARYAGASRADSRARMLRTHSSIRARGGLQAWQLTQRKPNNQDFIKWYQPGLSVAGGRGKKTIPHDRAERTTASQWLFRGYVQRPPTEVPQQRQESQAAGQLTPPVLTLVLDARLLHPVSTPLMRGVLGQIARWHRDDEEAQALRAGLITIRLSTQIEMHSHAVQWRSIASGSADQRRPEAITPPALDHRGSVRPAWPITPPRQIDHSNGRSDQGSPPNRAADENQRPAPTPNGAHSVASDAQHVDAALCDTVLCCI